MPNLPPQTGIIDFLRRLGDVNDSSFLDKFDEDPVALMTICGLTAPQQQAILSRDTAQVAAEVGKEFFLPSHYDFVRMVQARSVKWGLDYTFPYPPPPHAPFTPQELVAQLQQDVRRIDGFIAQLADSLQ